MAYQGSFDSEYAERDVFDVMAAQVKSAAPSSLWHNAQTEKPEPRGKYVIIRMRDGNTWVGKWGFWGKSKKMWSSGGFRLVSENVLWWMYPEDLPATPEDHGIPG